MRASRRLVLQIVATDRTFEEVEYAGRRGWAGKCIHCNRQLVVAADGTPLLRATIEHIVPRGHGGTDELENLALACGACNHEKGVRHDRRPASDAKLQEIVERLRRRRTERWRAPPLSIPD